MCTKPYTLEELEQLKCFCGEQATQQWFLCANDSWKPICTKCDIMLNGIVLDFMGDPNTVEKMKKYREKMNH